MQVEWMRAARDAPVRGERDLDRRVPGKRIDRARGHDFLRGMGTAEDLQEDGHLRGVEGRIVQEETPAFDLNFVRAR